MLVSIPCCTPSSGWISETTSGRSYGTSGAWGRTTCQRDGPHGPPLKFTFPRAALWMARTMKMALRLPCDLVLIEGKVPSIVTDRLISIDEKWKFIFHLSVVHLFSFGFHNQLFTFMLFQTCMTFSFVSHKKKKSDWERKKVSQFDWDNMRLSKWINYWINYYF